jgi:hypothetical protein
MLRRYAIFLILLISAAYLLRFILTSDGAGDWSSLKSFVTPFAALYLETFNNPATALSLSVSMVVIGVSSIAIYWVRKVGPASRELKHIIGQLGKITSTPGSRVAFHSTDDILAQSHLLSRSWKLYRATLTATAEGGRAALHQPSLYLNARSLERAGIRLRFLQGLANDFVGIGLVFTFLGLVAGLYFASRGMLAADLGSARVALVQLLHASTFKFLTSITGIGMSLLSSWAHRLLVNRLYAQLDEVTTLVEENLPPATNPALASAPEAQKPAIVTDRRHAAVAHLG